MLSQQEPNECKMPDARALLRIGADSRRRAVPQSTSTAVIDQGSHSDDPCGLRSLIEAPCLRNLRPHSVQTASPSWNLSLWPHWQTQPTM